MVLYSFMMDFSSRLGSNSRLLRPAGALRFSRRPSLGRRMSQSTNSTFLPASAKDNARFTAVVLFPSLWREDVTTTTLLFPSPAREKVTLVRRVLYASRMKKSLLEARIHRRASWMRMFSCCRESRFPVFRDSFNRFISVSPSSPAWQAPSHNRIFSCSHRPLSQRRGSAPEWAHRTEPSGPRHP